MSQIPVSATVAPAVSTVSNTSTVPAQFAQPVVPSTLESSNVPVPSMSVPPPSIRAHPTYSPSIKAAPRMSVPPPSLSMPPPGLATLPLTLSTPPPTLSTPPPAINIPAPSVAMPPPALPVPPPATIAYSPAVRSSVPYTPSVPSPAVAATPYPPQYDQRPNSGYNMYPSVPQPLVPQNATPFAQPFSVPPVSHTEVPMVQTREIFPPEDLLFSSDIRAYKQRMAQEKLSQGKCIVRTKILLVIVFLFYEQGFASEFEFWKTGIAIIFVRGRGKSEL